MSFFSHNKSVTNLLLPDIPTGCQAKGLYKEAKRGNCYPLQKLNFCVSNDSWLVKHQKLGCAKKEDLLA